VSGPGRLLAVDYGNVRIGLAISDPDRKIASPLTTYARRSAQSDAEFFRQLTREEQIVALVVGLPVHLSGREGQSSEQARAFGKWLNDVTALPIVFFDERFTTVEAEAHLLDAGLTNKRRKARRDRVAAQILLQSYLDAGCPPEQRIAGLDE
jgi:putative Holliday junction resolvase